MCAAANSICERLPVEDWVAAVASERTFCASATKAVANKETSHLAPHTGRGHTYLVCEPLLFHIHGIPNPFREIGRAFVHVNKLDELCVQVRVAKCTVGHERIVEVPWVVRVALERQKGSDLRLCPAVRTRGHAQHTLAEGRMRTFIVSSHGVSGSDGIPQASTPGIGGGRRSCLSRVSSAEDPWSHEG